MVPEHKGLCLRVRYICVRYSVPVFNVELDTVGWKSSANKQKVPYGATFFTFRPFKIKSIPQDETVRFFYKKRPHLRESTVRTLEAGHALADEVMDVALLHRCRQVQAR